MVLGAVHTSQISEICVIFIVFTDGQREIICPRSHGKGWKLLFSSGLSDYQVIPPQYWSITERIRSVRTNKMHCPVELWGERSDVSHQVFVVGNSQPPGVAHCDPNPLGPQALTILFQSAMASSA